MLRVQVGDTVIGEVVKLNEKSGEIRIINVEGKANRSVMADQEYAQFHVTKITDRFLHNTADGLRRRDIVRAKVLEAGNVIRIDMREDDDCGVLWALCPSCGDTFHAELNGDWNVACKTCGNKSFRAMADDFGGETGKAAMNGAGKRWSGEAEALFAKGSAGRATFIAEDIREDGREREYFRFEGEGGQGGRGRREKAAPGCRLFIGGLSRDAEEDEVRDMFKNHGKVTDFALMRDDDGNLRGFGFITFQSKDMADAAIAALNGQKIKGRRIGVRDADAPRDEKPKRAPKPQGARLYVGNLPFKATEDDLSALFKDHCDTVHVQWATDRSGRKKAFAFVTIQPESKGEEVVSKLNGSDFMGRNIKVDVSKPQNRENKGKSGGNSGGKSARSCEHLLKRKKTLRKRSVDDQERNEVNK